MGVYIKDVEIPESCPCVFAGDGYDPCCSFVYGIPKRVKEYDECCENVTKPDWCPLIEVPPHGDLIERLDVIGYCGIPQGREDTFDSGVMWLAERIDELPTIIPAEEG